jgi:hypothetical protein
MNVFYYSSKGEEEKESAEVNTAVTEESCRSLAEEPLRCNSKSEEDKVGNQLLEV